MDLSGIPTADLEHIANGDMTRVSTASLEMLADPPAAPVQKKTQAEMQRDFAKKEGTAKSAFQYGTPKEDLQRKFARDQGTAKTASQHGTEDVIDGVPRWGREHPNLYALSKTVTGGIELDKPTEAPTSITDFATRVVPTSAVKTVVGAATAPYHMIKNVTDPIVEYASNPLKATPEPVSRRIDNGMVENAKSVLDFMAAPLGGKRDESGNMDWSIENAKNQWSTDPVGSLLATVGAAKSAKEAGSFAKDASSFAVDKALGLAADTKMFNPERLARSAIKPYNGEQVARQKAVTKGLETAVSDPNATPRMSKFLTKNLAEMEDIAGRQEVLLDEKGNPRVSIKGVRDSLQGTVDSARGTPGTADSAVSSADRVLNDITNHPEYDAATDTIPLNTVQTMKKNIWRKLREGNTFNKDAVPGLQDAMWDAATGMNSIINEFIPEMKAENARYGELANVNKLLKKAADRHAGNNLIPLRALIQLTRGDVQGFMQGATMWAIDHPTFKMYLAQRLAKARGRGATPTEVNNIVNGIKNELVQRQQTVLDSESLPKVTNDNIGDAIPGGQGLAYGWEGKPSTLTGEPRGATVANPEALPPVQSGVGETITGGFQREVGWDGKPLPLTEQPTGPAILNPESLPRNSRSNMGDAIPNGYQREYGWEGKPQVPQVANPEALPPRPIATNLGDELRPNDYTPVHGWEGKAPEQVIANPETLPPRQSSQMPQLSEQGGRVVPHVEAMTPRVPEGFNPEVIGMGAEDVQLGDRLAPKPRPLRNIAESLESTDAQNGPVAGLSEAVDTSLSPATVESAPPAAHTWQSYLSTHMSRAMKETGGDHGKAMKLLGEEWRKDKSKDPLGLRGGKK